MSRLPGLGGLRGVAALFVVVFHAFIVYSGATGDRGGALALFVYLYGWTGVDLFFVMSAFLLAVPLMRADRSPQPWAVYATKRFMRIAPPYYATIALTALVLGTQAPFLLSHPELWRHLFYVHNLFPDSVIGLNAVFWTLAIEMQFYLVLPLVAPLFRSRHWAYWLGAAALVTLIWRGFAFVPGDSPRTFWATAQIPAFAFHFALGLTAARLHVDGFRLARPGWSALGAATLFILLPLWLLPERITWFGATSFWTNLLMRPTLALGFVVVLLAVVDARSVVSRWLDSRPAHALGECSYSLYLTHYPAMVFLLVVAPFLVGYGFGAFMLVATLGSLVVAAGMYWVVERPSLHAKRLVATWIALLVRARRSRPAPSGSRAAPPDSPAAQGPGMPESSPRSTVVTRDPSPWGVHATRDGSWPGAGPRDAPDRPTARIPDTSMPHAALSEP